MDRDKTRAFLDRFTTLASGATTIGLLAVADRSGLLAALTGHEANTVDEVAARAGLNPRYVREILNGLVAAEVLEYEPVGSLYRLPDEHAAVIADDGSPYSMTGWLDMIPTALSHTEDIVNAAKHGGGVPFEAFGERMVNGIDRGNRPSTTVLLTRRWLAAMPDIVEQLETAGGTIADFGCGSGAAAQAMARAYPNATVKGYDISAVSIDRARSTTSLENATYVLGGIDTLVNGGPFDLVTALDVIHDLADPLGALKGIRSSLTPGGVLFMMDPRVDARVENNRNVRAALLYGFSTFHCMTQSLAAGGAGLGAAWGPSKARSLCEEAGFTTFSELPIDNPFSAFFRVH
jgi:2-polyprenyl-3-methyl-5-hydroxy-6-metoxy-1,4-benzoquinol methylase